MNMMHLVASQPLTQTAQGGLVGGKDIASSGSAFSTLMSNFTTNFQTISTSVETASPAELFSLQLTQLIGLLESRVAWSDLEGSEEHHLGLDLEVDDLEVDEESATLLAYLSNLLQEFIAAEEETGLDPNKKISNNEHLFLLFQSIPSEKQISLNSLQTLDYAVSSKVDLSQGQVVMKQETAEINQALQRWNLLLADLQSYLQAQDQDSSGLTENPRQAVLASLLNRWQENQDWLSFLREKVEQARLANFSSAVGDQHTLTRTNSVPFLLLNQLGGGEEQNPEQHEQEMLFSAKETSASVLNKSGIQTENTNLDLRISQSEGLKLPLTDSKPTEAPAQPLRFSHVTEDLKAVFSQHLRLLKDGETAQLRLRITPEHLGHLDIRITAHEGKIIAQLMASSTVAKELLEAQVQQLRLSLVQQGVQVERVEVTQATNQQPSFLHDQRDAQQFFQQRENKGGLETGKHYLDTLEEDEQEQESDTLAQLTSQINYVV